MARLSAPGHIGVPAAASTETGETLLNAFTADVVHFPQLGRPELARINHFNENILLTHCLCLFAAHVRWRIGRD
ncbi:MAG: hypothetical protein ACKVKM_11100 [Verrucomicrobiia bacterium]|jgi:hypothetical protein